MLDIENNLLNGKIERTTTMTHTKLTFESAPIQEINDSFGDKAWKKHSFDAHNGKFRGRLNIYHSLREDVADDWVFAICKPDGTLTHVFRAGIPDFIDENALIEAVKSYAQECYDNKDDEFHARLNQVQKSKFKTIEPLVVMKGSVDG